MRAFQPQVKVTLVKTRRRESLGQSGGQDVLPDLRRLGQFRELDLTPFLMDGGGVRTSKSVRQPAGTFSLTLNDRPALGDSLYGLIEPMDIVEIRMARGPVARGADLPVVMRGLVSSVQRTETIDDGGRPQRAVNVAGQDFGKILELLRIYYLPGSVVGEIWLDEFKFYRQYNLDAKTKPAADFFAEVVSRLVNTYFQQMVAVTQAPGLSVVVPNSFLPVSSVTGTVSPIGVASFQGGSAYELLAQFLDIGAFNELFVDDREDGVSLVCRPVPFRDLSGAVIDPAASFETVSLGDADLMSISATRSDSGVANYFWVGNGSWELNDNGTLQLLALQGDPDSYTTFGYVNTLASLYGYRKMEVNSQLGDPLALRGMGPDEAGVAQERNANARWLESRRRVLRLSNVDNVVLESGQMRLKGNETVRAGQYLDLQRGAMTSTQYAVAVYHEFQPAIGFFTTVDFERGTGFVERQSRVGQPWFDERTERGVS